MDKSPTPTMIQNRNLTEGLTTPEIDARLYESLLERPITVSSITASGMQ